MARKWWGGLSRPCRPGSGGPGRGGGDTNIQGVIVNDMIGRCNLNAISLGSAAVGPCYTYASGDTRSIVDYILADEEATNMLHQCRTLPFEDLHTVIVGSLVPAL